MSSPKTDIQLFNQSDTAIPVDTEQVKTVAGLVAEHEGCGFALLEVVYVNEPEIIRINSEHLDRSYVTDVITFRYDEDPENKHIEGTLFCCAPRIVEQAAEYNQDTGKEFTRVLVHGLLHLAGYEDQSSEEKEQMTGREDFYLRELGN